MKKRMTALGAAALFMIAGSVSADELNTAEGVLTNNNEEAVHTYHLTEGGLLQMNASMYFDYARIALKDKENNTVFSDTLYNGRSDSPDKDSYEVYLEPGQYTLHVSGSMSENEAGKYNVKAVFDPAGNTESEPNNGTVTAQQVAENGTELTGLLSWNDSMDYYKVELDKAGKLTAEGWAYFSHAKFRLIDQNGTAVISDTLYNGSRETPEVWNESRYLEPGIYYIAASRSSNGGTYDLKLSFEAANNTESEPNNGTTQAQLFPNSGKVEGLTSWNDDTDYYTFTLSQDKTVDFRLLSYFSYAGITLMDAKQNRLFSDTLYNGSSTTPEVFTKAYALPKGQYYIKVEAKGSYRGMYSLSAAGIYPAKLSFKDVGSAYQPAVEYLLNRSITNGMSPAEFGTGKPITRADAAVWIAKAMGIDTMNAPVSGFKDVPVRAQAAVNALKYKGIVGGKTDQLFGSNASLTRGEIAIILDRAYSLSANGKSSSFTDVSDRYSDAVNALVANGITNGISKTKFGVSSNVTRGQLAIFLYRLAE